MASSQADKASALGSRSADRLSLTDAAFLVGAALDAARAAGFAGAAAVVDAGGHLVAFQRDDGALFLTALVAQRKAWTAASAGMPTDRWTELAADPSVAPILHLPGMMAVAGGVPVFCGGRLVGALGVSGGSAEQDGAAARQALSRLATEAHPS